MRLSEHFLLLDFLYSQLMLDCVVHHGDSVARRIGAINEKSDVFVEGRYLCESILERIVAVHGPVSIAAGLWFSDLKGFGNEFSSGPHKWQPDKGAAADIVINSWVNEEKSPTAFLESLSSSSVDWHRAISYKGSEFFCIASRNRSCNCSSRA